MITWRLSNKSFFYYKSPKIKSISISKIKTGISKKIYIHSTKENSFGAALFAKSKINLLGNHFICKFENEGISPGIYINSTTMTCNTPKFSKKGGYSKLLISLNGEDFIDTGFTIDFLTKSTIDIGFIIILIIVILIIILSIVYTIWRNCYKNKKYNNEGFDQNGFDKNGFNKQGFNIEGFNQDNLSAVGLHRNEYKNGYDSKGFDPFGFDQFCYDERGYNKKGFDKDGNKEFSLSMNKENKNLLYENDQI